MNAGIQQGEVERLEKQGGWTAGEYQCRIVVGEPTAQRRLQPGFTC